MAQVKETDVTRNKIFAAMGAVNVNAVDMTGHMKRTVELTEEANGCERAKTKAAERAWTFASLEKRCHLTGGRNMALNAKLNQWLSEECEERKNS